MWTALGGPFRPYTPKNDSPAVRRAFQALLRKVTPRLMIIILQEDATDVRRVQGHGDEDHVGPGRPGREHREVGGGGGRHQLRHGARREGSQGSSELS